MAFLLILIIGSSYFLATKLNANLAKTQQHEETGIALSAAKEALIGYAITFPDRDTNGVVDGPGYLPCPDRDNDGDTDAGSCSLAGNTTIGRLPYKTLEVAELRDESGQRFWYALSDNFRNNPKLTPLNSETGGELSVNGTSDIVAIIIAPGEPLDGQDRDPDEIDITIEIDNYLEDDNNDLDVNYVTIANVDFNDRLIVITRQELMEAVEKRVLGEVSKSINSYQSVHNAFPWLSPFATPSTSKFRAQAGISGYQGHLPYHWSDDLPGASTRNPFNTSLSVSWNIVDADLSPGTFISDATMENSSVPVDITDASCEWTNRNSVKCTGTKSFPDPTCSSVSGTCPQTGAVSCDRSYDFDLEFLDESAATVSITDPDPANVRTRDVTIDISLLTTILTNYSIQVTDSNTIKGPNPPCNLNTFIETRSLTIDVGSSTGTITIAGIHYDLDVDGMDLNADDDYDDAGEFSPEIPEWLFNNNWHHLVYIGYATGETLPGDTTDTTPADGVPDNACTSGTDCLELNNSGSPNDNKRAIAIIAGEVLTGQDRTTSPAITDWFENENNNGNDIFDKADSTSTFNDQIRIISTN